MQGRGEAIQRQLEVKIRQGRCKKMSRQGA